MSLRSNNLNKLQAEAQTKLEALLAKINKTDDMLKDRLGGKGRGALIAGMFVSVLWAVIYCVLYGVLREKAHPLLMLVTLGVSVLLTLFLLIGNLVQVKYYGTILKARSRLLGMRNQVESAKRALSAELATYRAAENNGWKLQLKPGQPVENQLRQIESQISGLQAASGGFIHGVKNVLYYIATVAWTVVCCMALTDVAMGILSDQISEKASNVICIIALILACIGAVIAAKIIWGATDCKVKNVTIFGTFCGPVVFALLILVVVLAILAFQLLMAALSFIIAAVVVLSCCCGG